MPKVMKEQRRKLSDDEAAGLKAAAAKLDAAKGKQRSAEQNLQSFADFCDEADAMLSTDLDKATKKQWEDRKAHCTSVQTKEETQKKKAAEVLVASGTKALDAAKKKVGKPLERSGDDWFVVEEVEVDEEESSSTEE